MMALEQITYLPEADSFLHAGLAGIWRYPGFDFSDELSRQNPIIEVAGPTPEGYQLVGRTILKKMLISNINTEAPKDIRAEMPFWKRITSKYSIDFVADAFNLPCADNTIGAIFVSAFCDHPYQAQPDSEDIGYRAPMIDEAARALQPGGLFVMQYGNVRNLRRLADNGLVPQLLKVNRLQDLNAVPPLNEHVMWSHSRSLFVFQKPHAQS